APAGRCASYPKTCPISKIPAGARPSRSFLRRPCSFCPKIPVPHARPFLPNNTGNGPATIFQSPPRGRSNNRSSPRIEFHVGAIPTMICVQSSGTPSANVCLPSSMKRHNTKLQNFARGQDVRFNITLKGNHFSWYITRCHIRITDAPRILGIRLAKSRARTPKSYENIIDTRSDRRLFEFVDGFDVGANPEHCFQRRDLH